MTITLSPRRVSVSQVVLGCYYEMTIGSCYLALRAGWLPSWLEFGALQVDRRAWR